MIVTLFIVSFLVGGIIGYFAKRYRTNKMIRQLFQEKEQKRLLETRNIIDL